MKTYLTVATGLIAGVTLMLAAAPAMARVNVELNVGIPGVYVQPEPVYVQPRPVYVQPRPVYVQPGPVYVQPQPYYTDRQYRRDWHERQWHHREMRAQRDSDHDGIPNRVDRDRDGDGVPNRYDSRPNNPYRY